MGWLLIKKNLKETNTDKVVEKDNSTIWKKE